MGAFIELAWAKRFFRFLFSFLRFWLEQGSSDSCHTVEYVHQWFDMKYEKRDVLLIKVNNDGVKITVRSANQGRDSNHDSAMTAPNSEYSSICS